MFKVGDIVENKIGLMLKNEPCYFEVIEVKNKNVIVISSINDINIKMLVCVDEYIINKKYTRKKKLDKIKKLYV